MDLSALLAREGIEAGDVDALMKWARHRSSALIARIEPGSPLAEALGAALTQSRNGTAVPVSAQGSPTRGAPRPVARAISRPYLGAAVAAALSGKQEDLDLAIETAAAEAAAEAEAAAAARAEAEAQAEAEAAAARAQAEAEAEAAAARALIEDLELPVRQDSRSAADLDADEEEPPDDDPSIGGFNRFALATRRRARAMAVTAPVPTSSQHLSRNFEIHHAEEQSSASGSWIDVPLIDDTADDPAQSSGSRHEQPEDARRDADPSGLQDVLPDLPGFETAIRANPRGDAEASGGLVLGIPDDEGSDVPMPRTQPPSAGTGPRPFPLASVADEDDDLFDALRETSGPHEAASSDQDDDDEQDDEQDDAQDDEQDEPYDSGPQAAAHPISGPQAAAHPVSGPQAMAHAGSAPQRVAPQPRPGASRPPPPPPPRRPPSTSTSVASSGRGTPPPPPPRDGKVRGRTRTTEPLPKLPSPEPVKRGKPRKKVVELSQPVRPVSGPRPAAAPSERSGFRPIPADDEVQAPVRHAVEPARRPVEPPRPTPEPPRRTEPSGAAVPDYLRDDDD